jgi:benzodiazapine receptor
MSAMTVTSHRSALADLVRSAVVALLAVVQIVVSGLGGSGVTGEPVWAVAQAYATPLLAAGWTFAIWAPIYAGFLGYAVHQLLPSQRGRTLHRETGWWMAASAVFNSGWVLALGARALPLAELLLIALLITVAVVFGRLSRVPASGLLERVVLRGTVALYAGWVSLATVLGTAATGVWVGLPGEGALAAIAAVVVLLAAAAIVSWVVLSGTAVVGYAAAVIWALTGIALNDPPGAVVVTGAVAIVVVVATTARRLTTAGNPVRVAWG